MGNTKSELDLLKQENARLLARIAELEQAVKEKGELIARIAELEQYKTDTVDLKTENIELKDRITKLEQKQSSTCLELLINPQPRRSDSENISDNTSDPKVTASSNSDICQELKISASHISAKPKPLEEKEINSFLYEKNKESISNTIRERNREKKLRSQDLSCENNSLSIETSKTVAIIDKSSITTREPLSPIIQTQNTTPSKIAEASASMLKIPYNQKIEQGIIQEVILFIQKEKSLTLSYEKTSSFCETNISETRDNNVDKDGRELAQLFSDAEIVEGKTIKAKQKEVVCWYTYRKAYQNNVADIQSKTGVSEKTAKNQVYTMIKASLPNVSETNLYKKTQRSGKVYKLFEKITDPITKEEIEGIGIGKVYGISYGVRSISELTDAQIINIIKQVAEKTRAILTVGRELTTEILPMVDTYISIDSKKSSEIVNVFGGFLDSNSDGSDDEENMDDPDNDDKYDDETNSKDSTKVNNRADFRNKMAEQYPDLYWEGSDGNDDYYGITDESLCPLCKLDHYEDKGIEGRYKNGSYFIKCEQRGIKIEITA